MYALVIYSKEATSGNGKVMTKAGEKKLVVNEKDGWVEATSRSWDSVERNGGKFPKDTKKFNTIESAQKFAETWEGHPWYCKPNGGYEIIPIKAKYKQVLEGYECDY